MLLSSGIVDNTRMERIVLTEHNIGEAAKRAAAVLRAGGVVLYPTDTLYGLGADALSDEAVAKIFAVKGRNEGKPVHALVSDLAMAGKYGEISDSAQVLAEKLPHGQVTFVVRKKAGINTGISKEIPTFGFRIPDNAFCIEMLHAFGGPITATSANRAGEVPQCSVDAIMAQLEYHSNVLQNVGTWNIDLIVDAGELPPRLPSSVVDVSGTAPVILREGAVSRSEIEAVLGQSRGV